MKAITDDLRLPGVHTPASTRVLSGRLDEVDGSAGMSRWPLTPPDRQPSWRRRAGAY